MARVAAAVQYPTPGGVAPAYTAATVDGIKFLNDGQVIVHILNTDASNILTATVITPGTVDGQAIGDRAITVPVSAERLVGRLQPNVYNRDPAAGTDPSMVYIDFTKTGGVTDVNYAVLHG